jgi:hypothetical protein
MTAPASEDDNDSHRLLELVELAGGDGCGVPRIEISGGPDAIRKLSAALAARAIPDLYVTSGQLVRIERVSGTVAVDLDDDMPLPVTASTLTTALLAKLLAVHTYTYKWAATKDKAGKPEYHEVETTPSPGVLSAAIAGKEWPDVPVLAGIIGTPVLRRDWSLLQAPGYDPASGLYLAPTVALPVVPEHPSRRQVAAAQTFVTGTLLGDFEWEDDASLANYVALMATPFLRRPLRALAPLFVISASAPASGKSLLSALTGLLTGQQVVTWPGDNEEELEKVITATFRKESGAVVFDNIPEGEVIGSARLAALLASPTWSGRILGTSGMGAWPNDRLWMATGNNLRIGGDIASRSVFIRLKPTAPHPEERTGFAIPDLQGWIMDPSNRVRLLERLLILVADWVAAGTPKDTTVPAIRQFTPWAHGVGGFLAHHGITGFLGNLSAMRAMDEEDRKWAVFLGAWLDKLGPGSVRPADVLASADDGFDQPAGPWEGDFITDDRGRFPRTAQKLGQLLAGQADRYHGDPPLTLRTSRDGHNKTWLYRVERWQG